MSLVRPTIITRAIEAISPEEVLAHEVGHENQHSSLESVLLDIHNMHISQSKAYHDNFSR